MIINDRKDLDAAPDAIREQFMVRLAGSINRWVWEGEWKLVQDESTIAKFGFGLSDFPDAPIPPKPDYNPEERELQQARESASLTRAQFKLGLLERGELDKVKAAMSSDSADPRAVILWEDAQVFNRTDPDLLRLATEMGYSEVHLDELFGINA